MARPKGRNGTPKRLYLNEAITSAADRIAFSRDESLSEMVERLLARELKRNGVTIPAKITSAQRAAA